MGTPIHIPVDDLKDTLANLADIRSRIEDKTGLERVGTEADVGDRQLIDAVNSFDSAWAKGHDRVQENVDSFTKSTQGIIDNFEQTDADVTQNIE
ncbi:hypothetical protein [Streptomyces sp. NPDC000410]|uniref:hypothetical protein n=1 Tax=Streptomyces sp. NPDC000410 TaxID=3154254 RepID=UPI00331D106F